MQRGSTCQNGIWSLILYAVWICDPDDIHVQISVALLCPFTDLPPCDLWFCECNGEKWESQVPRKSEEI